MKTYVCSYCGDSFVSLDNRKRKYCPDKDCRKLADKKRRREKKILRRAEIDATYSEWRQTVYGKKCLAFVESEIRVFLKVWKPKKIDYRAVVGCLRMKYDLKIPNNYVRGIREEMEGHKND